MRWYHPALASLLGLFVFTQPDGPHGLAGLVGSLVGASFLVFLIVAAWPSESDEEDLPETEGARI